jgi:hypothetical protein
LPISDSAPKVVEAATASARPNRKRQRVNLITFLKSLRLD